jgi:hypothetical protein
MQKLKKASAEGRNSLNLRMKCQTIKEDSFGVRKGAERLWSIQRYRFRQQKSFLPSQVFYPMVGENEGWSTLAKNLRAEIDEEKMEVFKGTISLPFELGDRKQVAIKIIDDRGIES